MFLFHLSYSEATYLSWRYTMLGSNVNNLLLIDASQDSIAQGLVGITVPKRGVGCEVYAHGLAVPHEYFLLEVGVELNLFVQ